MEIRRNLYVDHFGEAYGGTLIERLAGIHVQVPRTFILASYECPMRPRDVAMISCD